MREFTKLGEVRSLIPSTVNVVALTATATTKNRNKITILGMCKPVIISESPDKSNLIYHVEERTTIDKVFTPLVEKIRREKTRMPRIIFCQK